MKILYHHRTQGRGAEGVHIREIVKALKNMGHEVLVISPRGVDISVEQGDHRFGGAHKAGIFTLLLGWISRHVPQIFFELLEIAYNLSSFRKIYILAKRGRIDALYERYHFFGFSGALLARHFGIPLVIEVNELSGFERIRGHVFVNLSRRIESFVFSKADAIIVVSKCLKRSIMELGVPGDKIHVIPNAVNLDEFNTDIQIGPEYAQKMGINGKISIGFIGYLVKWHKLDFLLECFARIVQENKNVCLVIVGDGPLRPDLERMSSQLGLNGYVIFVGNVLHTEIPKYLKLLNVCVIPHSNEYRSPIKMFEYMAMAKPVVVPDTEPIKDVVRHEVDGLIFERENCESFIKNLTGLINNEHKRLQIGQEAYNTITLRHLWKHNAAKVINIFMEHSRH